MHCCYYCGERHLAYLDSSRHLRTLKTIILLSWWCPFWAGKWHFRQDILSKWIDWYHFRPTYVYYYTLPLRKNFTNIWLCNRLKKFYKTNMRKFSSYFLKSVYSFFHISCDHVCYIKNTCVWTVCLSYGWRRPPKRFLFPFKLFLSMKTSHTSYTSWNVNVSRISSTRVLLLAIAERQIKKLGLLPLLVQEPFTADSKKIRLPPLFEQNHLQGNDS